MGSIEKGTEAQADGASNTEVTISAEETIKQMVTEPVDIPVQEVAQSAYMPANESEMTAFVDAQDRLFTVHDQGVIRGEGRSPLTLGTARSNGRIEPIDIDAAVAVSTGDLIVANGSQKTLVRFSADGRPKGEIAKAIGARRLAVSPQDTLAALDVVRLPSRVVEPLIAASIVYVAAENLIAAYRDVRPSVLHRALLTFGFGLVHGLGFATVLRESGLGSSGRGVAGPLVQFNLGVESGQLAVAAVVFPLILAMRRRPALQFDRRWVPTCSAAVAAAGAWWLVQRVAL